MTGPARSFSQSVNIHWDLHCTKLVLGVRERLKKIKFLHSQREIALLLSLLMMTKLPMGINYVPWEGEGEETIPI